MSEFVEVKTDELSGAALDWAVAQVEGVEYLHAGIKCRARLTARTFHHYTKPNFMPSTDWSHGGPLIEKYAITLMPFSMEFNGAPHYWTADPWRERAFPADGATPLIAACGAIVASVLGDTVSVPKELIA